MLGDDGVDECLDRVVVTHVARVEVVRQALDGTPRARHDGGALAGEDGADARTDSAHTTGHEDDATAQLRD